MKALKFLLVIIIPVMISCNSQPNRQGANRNETTDTETGNGMGTRSYDDQGKDNDFIKEALNGSLIEIEMGRYAQQNALNPRVKQYGAMMVRDHTKASEELKKLAARKNVSLSDAMEDRNRSKISELEDKTGNDFDEAYIKEMVDDHEKDVDKFRKTAEEGEDSEIKAFAAKQLPILLMHQDSAKSIRDALK